jgi:FkbM family methyltransferase
MRGVVRRLAMAPLWIVGTRLRAEAIERFSISMITEVPVPGGRIRFDARFPLLLARAANLLSKEEDTIRWIDNFEDKAIFWDIGANVGVYSLYAAVRKDLRVLAFEPSAANFHVLSHNIQLNDLSDRVTAYCVAFSDRTQLGILNLIAPKIGDRRGPPMMGGALSQFGMAGEQSRYASNADYVTQGMFGFTIDEFVTRFHPPRPTHIKLDVDGLELPILTGAKEALCHSGLRSLMVELTVTHKTEREETIRLLEDAGLYLVSQGKEQGATSEMGANHLFERHPPI